MLPDCAFSFQNVFLREVRTPQATAKIHGLVISQTYIIILNASLLMLSEIECAHQRLGLIVRILFQYDPTTDYQVCTTLLGACL